jgi:hypothetical protein
VPNFFEKMIVKMLTHMHMVFYIWWCLHICKGEGVGVGIDQLEEERKIFRCSPDTRMDLEVEYCFDPLVFGSNSLVGCVAL